MNKYILTVLINAMFLSLMAQKHDNVWMTGYGGGEASTMEDDFGITVFDFSEDTLSISEDFDISMHFNSNAVSMCDEKGKLLFYTNGNHIENHVSEIMENGTGLQDRDRGYITPQGVLALPFPEKEREYILLNTINGWVDLPGWGLEVRELYYSIIDMKANNGLGAVTIKKEPLLLDTIQYGKLTATKHANGRDWWILVNEGHTNRFHTVLLNPQGLSIHHNQSSGSNEVEGLGQAVFSPDGTKYVTLNMISEEIGSFLQIFDFDRCTGRLSNPVQLHYNESAQSGGVAISPNSRYLYFSSYNNIYQYDLWVTDIASSQIKVAVYDGFQSPFSTRFFLAQLAPDGKIYINSPNGVNVMHVIHNPNEAGAACKVEQHGIQLPTYNGFSMPNHPNYRLGALEGSSCDTIRPISTTATLEDRVKITTYPNPVQHQLTVDLTLADYTNLNQFQLELTNLYGQVIEQRVLRAYAPIYRFEVGDLPRGVYFINLYQQGEFVISKKVVLQ